jgi:electron transport complex protein RnfG
VNESNFTKIAKLVLVLAIVCVIAAGGLALTYAATEKQIAVQEEKQMMESNLKALPLIKSSEGFKERTDLVKEVKKQEKDVVKVFEGSKDGKTVGWVVQVGPRGYGGPLIFAVGIDSRGKVTGMAIIDNKETPGLGQNVQKPEFQEQFIGKSAKDALEVKKDIDALTGATISSKAVTLGVKEAVQAVKIVGGK